MQRIFQQASVDLSNGFLPGTRPVTKLPDNSEYHKRLNDIISNLPTLIKEKLLRKTIDDLDKEFVNAELSLEKGNKAQKNTAIMFIVAIAQGYIFEDTKNPANIIPAVIAKNLYLLCKSRQRFPMITYADYVLNNWRMKNPCGEITLDNIEPIFTFTGTTDEAWFIKIHVAIESACGQALRAAEATYLEAKNSAPDTKKMSSALTAIAESLQKAIDVMHEMKTGCNPDTFWDIMRPYLSGWDKIKATGSDDLGVKFAGIRTKDTKPFDFTGPSGAQSSIVPALDNALRIKHEIDGMFKLLLKFKEYMPNDHQAFIAHFSDSKIKTVVYKSGSPTLIDAFKSAIDAVQKMRGAHLGLVHQYIYKTAGARGIPAHVITGTGGAPIDGYLAGRYEDTLKVKKV